MGFFIFLAIFYWRFETGLVLFVTNFVDFFGFLTAFIFFYVETFASLESALAIFLNEYS
jgi:hypothetical protein